MMLLAFLPHSISGIPPGEVNRLVLSVLFLSFVVAAAIFGAVFTFVRLHDRSIEREIRKRTERRVRRTCFVCNGSGRRAKLSSAPCSWCEGKGFFFINETRKDS